MHVLAYRSLMSINAIEGHHRNVYGRIIGTFVVPVEQ